MQLSRSCERATEEGDGSGHRGPMTPSFSKLSRHLDAPWGQERKKGGKEMRGKERREEEEERRKGDDRKGDERKEEGRKGEELRVKESMSGGEKGRK